MATQTNAAAAVPVVVAVAKSCDVCEDASATLYCHDCRSFLCVANNCAPDLHVRASMKSHRMVPVEVQPKDQAEQREHKEAQQQATAPPSPPVHRTSLSVSRPASPQQNDRRMSAKPAAGVAFASGPPQSAPAPQDNRSAASRPEKCGQCEKAPAEVFCSDCCMNLCVAGGCDTTLHKSGRNAAHARSPLRADPTPVPTPTPAQRGSVQHRKASVSVHSTTAAPVVAGTAAQPAAPGTGPAAQHLSIEVQTPRLAGPPPARRVSEQLPASSRNESNRPEEPTTPLPAPLCENCEEESAENECDECAQRLCASCDEEMHKPRKMAAHTRRRLDGRGIVRDVRLSPAPSPSHRSVVGAPGAAPVVAAPTPLTPTQAGHSAAEGRVGFNAGWRSAPPSSAGSKARSVILGGPAGAAVAGAGATTAVNGAAGAAAAPTPAPAAPPGAAFHAEPQRPSAAEPPSARRPSIGNAGSVAAGAEAARLLEDLRRQQAQLQASHDAKLNELRTFLASRQDELVRGLEAREQQLASARDRRLEELVRLNEERLASAEAHVTEAARAASLAAETVQGVAVALEAKQQQQLLQQQRVADSASVETGAAAVELRVAEEVRTLEAALGAQLTQQVSTLRESVLAQLAKLARRQHRQEVVASRIHREQEKRDASIALLMTHFGGAPVATAGGNDGLGGAGAATLPLALPGTGKFRRSSVVTGMPPVSAAERLQQRNGTFSSAAAPAPDRDRDGSDDNSDDMDAGDESGSSSQPSSGGARKREAAAPPNPASSDNPAPVAQRQESADDRGGVTTPLEARLMRSFEEALERKMREFRAATASPPPQPLPTRDAMLELLPSPRSEPVQVSMPPQVHVASRSTMTLQSDPAAATPAGSGDERGQHRARLRSGSTGRAAPKKKAKRKAKAQPKSRSSSSSRRSPHVAHQGATRTRAPAPAAATRRETERGGRATSRSGSGMLPPVRGAFVSSGSKVRSGGALQLARTNVPPGAALVDLALLERLLHPSGPAAAAAAASAAHAAAPSRGASGSSGKRERRPRSHDAADVRPVRVPAADLVDVDDERATSSDSGSQVGEGGRGRVSRAGSGGAAGLQHGEGVPLSSTSLRGVKAHRKDATRHAEIETRAREAVRLLRLVEGKERAGEVVSLALGRPLAGSGPGHRSSTESLGVVPPAAATGSSSPTSMQAAAPASTPAKAVVGSSSPMAESTRPGHTSATMASPSSSQPQPQMMDREAFQQVLQDTLLNVARAVAGAVASTQQQQQEPAERSPGKRPSTASGSRAPAIASARQRPPSAIANPSGRPAHAFMAQNRPSAAPWNPIGGGARPVW